MSFRDTEIRTLGIVGSGAMGRGIAQIAALGGLTVRLYDTNQPGHHGRARVSRRYPEQTRRKRQADRSQCRTTRWRAFMRPALSAIWPIAMW